MQISPFSLFRFLVRPSSLLSLSPSPPHLWSVTSWRFANVFLWSPWSLCSRSNWSGLISLWSIDQWTRGGGSPLLKTCFFISSASEEAETSYCHLGSQIWSHNDPKTNNCRADDLSWSWLFKSKGDGCLGVESRLAPRGKVIFCS